MGLTDRDILEACARACGVDPRKLNHAWPERFDDDLWCPLTDDGDCARMENKCGLVVDCMTGNVRLWDDNHNFIQEFFTPGNDAERRRASCLVVARTQLDEEKTA